MQTWRYIPPIATTGAEQMAIDTWLLEQHRLGLHPPTFRCYTWSPVAISLGYHQKNYPAAWENLRYQNQKIDLVRRPSGGRAVLHQGDLSYAIITSGLTGTRQQIYESLCDFLIQAWRSHQIPLSYGQQQRNYTHHDSCFHSHTKADLVTPSGQKLIGNAQLRRGQALLQHGSIRLNPDPQLHQQIFPEDPIFPVTTISGDRLPMPPGDRLIATLKQTLQTSLNITLITQPLQPQEWQNIRATIPLAKY